jgi:hypothetical protein
MSRDMLTGTASRPKRAAGACIPLRTFDAATRALAQARGLELVRADLPGMLPASRLRAAFEGTAGDGPAGSFSVRGACGHSWAVAIPASGRLRRGWWRCPSGCRGEDASAAGAARR